MEILWQFAFTTAKITVIAKITVSLNLKTALRIAHVRSGKSYERFSHLSIQYSHRLTHIGVTHVHMIQHVK